jgi:hypothetical protein
LTVLLPVGAGRELHVVLINLIIDGLFALIVRGGPRIGPGSRREDEGDGANNRYQCQSAIATHGNILKRVFDATTSLSAASRCRTRGGA